MIKVTEAISDTNIGGAGILLLNRLRHTDDKKIKTTVVLPQDSLLTKKLNGIGIRTISIKGCKDRSFDIRAILEYYNVLKKTKPDIVNSHGSLSFRIAAKLADVPLKIYTRHCVYPVKNQNPFLKAVRGWGSSFLSDHIIAVAYAAKENLFQLGINKNKISVIINGAEGVRKLTFAEKNKLRAQYGIASEEKVVTICARLEACKDHSCFLKAAKLLTRTSDNYKFLIIGGGSLERYLKKTVNRSNLKDKVIFTGFVDDVAPLLNITDIIVNCSIGTETSSLALSEGMSLGIPAVVSDFGGNPYMVRDGVNGYVYKARDYRELAQKIQKALKIGEYSKLSDESKKRFEQELNAARMAKRTQELYLKCYNEKMKPKR